MQNLPSSQTGGLNTANSVSTGMLDTGLSKDSNGNCEGFG